MFTEFEKLRKTLVEDAPNGRLDPVLRSIAVILISLAVLITGIMLVLRQDSPASAQIGAGLIGMVVAYWLK